MTTSKKDRDRLVINDKILKQAIGWIAISLPFVLWAGARLLCCDGLQRSISAYYYTVMGDYFVGALCAIGLLLFSYNGYDHIDFYLGKAAGLFALGVALLPSTPESVDKEIPKYLIECVKDYVDMIGYLHFGSAAIFLSLLAIFSYFRFTKTDPEKKIEITAEKRNRNIIYKTCGVVIWISLILIAIVFWKELDERSYQPVFILESIAVVSFSISWLVKGGFLLKDPNKG